MNKPATKSTARPTRWFASPVVLTLSLLVLIAGAFSPLLSSGFIDFDDDLYVTANPYVRAGLTWRGFAWALHSTAASNWHPVTWWAHMLNAQLYGLHPAGHHLTSLLLHAVNTLLVLFLLWRLTAALWPSLFVAALFALHPLHVESVAWAAELKDVLSTLFFLLTLWFYTRYTDAVQIPAASVSVRPLVAHPMRIYALSLVLFALGLMTKPMLVSLPLVMLLLDYWPLRRWSTPPLRLVVEKIPFIALAAASCVVTYVVQRQTGALTQMAGTPLVTRLEHTALSYCWYLQKSIWPAHLTLFYPFPDHISLIHVIAAVVVLLAITIAAVVWRRRWPWFLVGWVWFGITLVPVIGLVQVGGQAMADRYTYIPLLGVFIIVAWGAQAVAAMQVSPSQLSQPELNPKTEIRNPKQIQNPTKQSSKVGGARASWGGFNIGGVFGVTGAIIMLVLGSVTFHQAGYWRNSETLWSHALACTSNNFLAHINLGLELQRQKRFEAATDQFRAAVQLRPDEAKAHANLANVLCRQEHVDEGIREFETAIQLDPNSAAARHNLGIALCRTGRLPDGIAQFEAVVKLRPDWAQAQFDLAMALASVGRNAEAVPHLERVLQLRPQFHEAERLLQRLRNAPGILGPRN